MKYKIGQDSFIKGEQFERFVEHYLFVEADYALVHRTNNYDQNRQRFSENTLKPDFKFRCKKPKLNFMSKPNFVQTLMQTIRWTS